MTDKENRSSDAYQKYMQAIGAGYCPDAEKQNKGNPLKRAVGFILTLLLLPILFIGTWIPLRAVLAPYNLVFSYLIHIAIFLWVTLVIAKETSNTGIKLAIKTIGIAIVALIMYNFLMIIYMFHS